MVKVHGNNVEIQDYQGKISMVHVTDVKKITLMEQVADDYEQLGKEEIQQKVYSMRLHTRLRLDNNTPKPGSTHQANQTTGSN